jgi:hypothetical protein
MIIDKKRDRVRKASVLMGFIIFCMLITGGVVSAELFSFDNIKSYDVASKTMTIVNTFGLGKDIATIQLKTPLEVVVPVGYQKVGEFQLTNYEDYLNAFEKMEFYNIKDNMKTIERQFDYKVLVNQSYVVNDYNKICLTDEKNQTNVCSYKIIGNHTIISENWVHFGEEDRVKGEEINLVKGEILTIGIFTEVYYGDNVEWILTAYGKDITEWASFVQSSGTKTYQDIGGVNYTTLTYTSNGTFNYTGTENLNVSILVVAGGGGGGQGTGGGAGGGAGGIVYNNSFSIPIGNYNLVIGAGGIGGSGASGNGGNGTNSTFLGISAVGGGGATDYQQRSYGGGSASGNGAFNTQTLANVINGVGGTSYGNKGGEGYNGDGGGGGGGGAGSVGINGIATYGGNGGNGTTFTIYNGTALYYGGGGGGGSGILVGVGGLGGGGNGGSGGIGGNGIINLGGGGGGGHGGYSNGGNGGSGIVIIRYKTSEAEIPIIPSVTLNSPINYFNTTNPSITFNITATDNQQITNVTLYIDGIVNETDTSQINGSYQWIKTLSEGNHNWSILAYNNNSKSNQSDIRTFHYACEVINVNTSWTNPVNSSCNITDLYFSSKSKIQYDSNFCGGANITFWGNTTNSCNYCSFFPINATIQDWFDIHTCSNITNTKTQNSTILTYDFNFDTCYALTSLEPDFFDNITYNLQQEISCSISPVSDESLFYVDLESRTTIVMFVFIFVFVILLGYFRKWLFVGGLLVIMGFILAFSGFNIILSFIIIASGVIAFFLK